MAPRYLHTARAKPHRLQRFIVCRWRDAPFAADQRSDPSPRGQRGRRMLPLPKPTRSARAMWLFKVQRLLRIDKGGEKRSYHLPRGSKL